MNIKILQAYIKKCKAMGINPTWGGLENFRKLQEKLVDIYIPP